MLSNRQHVFVASMALFALSAPAAELSGVVRVLPHFPVEDASVTLCANTDAWASIYVRSCANQTALAKTDKAGHFAITAIPGGTYDLRISAKGFSILWMAQIQLAEVEKLAIEPILNIGCGDTVGVILRYSDSPPGFGGMSGIAREAIVHRQKRYAEVTGLGPPIIGATVTLICENQIACGSATTDAKGRYSFSNLKPGRYNLRIDAAGYYQRQAYPYPVLARFTTLNGDFGVEKCSSGNCAAAVINWTPHSCGVWH